MRTTNAISESVPGRMPMRHEAGDTFVRDFTFPFDLTGSVIKFIFSIVASHTCTVYELTNQ